MTPRIRFSAAMSVDGYIAGPNGEDWIVPDSETDFPALMAQFDTLLVGRRTFETMVRAKRTTMPGMRTVVLSTTQRQVDYPDVTIVGDEVEAAVRGLRANSQKDVWLFGGGDVFRRLLDAGLVDSVELAIEPILLGDGIPLVRDALHRQQLHLVGHRVSTVGVVRLEYAVRHSAA